MMFPSRKLTNGIGKIPRPPNRAGKEISKWRKVEKRVVRRNCGVG